MLHNHLWTEGVACLDEVESFSGIYVDEPEFFRGRAQGHWWLGEFDRALADYQTAWNLGLKTAGMVDALSDALMNAGRYADALATAAVEVEPEETAVRAVLRRIILRDVVALTGVTEQNRHELDAAEVEAMSHSNDAGAIRNFLVERDTLAPTLLIRLAHLEDLSPTGGAILLAIWNPEAAPLWVLALQAAVSTGEDRQVIESLARAGVEASPEFLEEFDAMVAAETSQDCAEHDWSEVADWVYGAAATSNPFRKGGLRPLGRLGGDGDG